MNNQPFRWNLQNKRALNAMLQTALHKTVPEIKVPSKDNQKGFAKAKKKIEIEKADIERLQRNSIRSTKKEESFAEDMLQCCARLLAQGAKYDLVFVGRSPESLFDHLSGMLLQTEFKNRLTLLQLSLRHYNKGKPNWYSNTAPLKKYFETVKLDPLSISRRKKPVAFVDLVYTGATFHSLILFLKLWSEDLNLNWQAVRAKIRLLGIVERRKTSPNTFRWQQHKRWKNLLDARSMKNVSIKPSWWAHLGNDQEKATETFDETAWTSESAYRPIRNVYTLVGLQNALYWFELGMQKERRKSFSDLLSEQPEMKEEELRFLVASLRLKH